MLHFYALTLLSGRYLICCLPNASPARWTRHQNRHLHLPMIHRQMPLRITPLFRLGCFRVSIRWFCGLIAQQVCYCVAFLGGEIWETWNCSRWCLFLYSFKGPRSTTSKNCILARSAWNLPRGWVFFVGEFQVFFPKSFGATASLRSCLWSFWALWGPALEA